MKPVPPRVLPAAACALALAALAQGREVKDGTGADAPLTQAGVQAAFQILQRDYIRSGELSFEQLNRAALDGLMRHLDGGARLVPLTPAEDGAAEPGVLRAVLAEGIGWLRPLTYQEVEVAEWTRALEEMREQGCRTLLLDLREPAPAGSFDVAARLLETVMPSGKVLFKLKQAGKEGADIRISSREPVWTGPLVVLADEQTCNVAEAMAAVLRQQRRALVVGARTPGALVRYQTLPLDESYAIQYASAELLLEDGTALFQKGLSPDLAVAMGAPEKTAARALMAQDRVRELVHEVARERFNEAALVARRNPELEDYLKRSAGEKSAGETLPPTDPVLQRAVDAVQSLETLDAARLQWKPAPDAQHGPPEVILKAPLAEPISGAP